MSDQNRFDPYKQKLLHYWGVLAAACGAAWEKTKTCAGKTAAFLRDRGQRLAERIRAWFAKARTWLGKVRDTVAGYTGPAYRKCAAWLRRGWGAVCRRAKHVRRVIAVWLLKLREKCRPAAEKIGLWLEAVKAWFRRVFPARPKKAPREETAAVSAVPAVPAETETDEAFVPVNEEEPVQAPARRLRITNPTARKVLDVLGLIGKYLKLTIKWLWKLRTIFMAVPVVWAAVRLAMENMARLPESVGLDIQSTGEFARMITRDEAVYWPLGITAFCLVLMFCSKKPLLPWVISIFTLVLPWLIWVLNYYA